MSGKVRRTEGRKAGWAETSFWPRCSSFSASCASASCGPSALRGPLPLHRPLPRLPLLLLLPLGPNHWPRSGTAVRMKERETTKE